MSGVEELGCCEGGEVPGAVIRWVIVLWEIENGEGKLPGITALVYVLGVAACVDFGSVYLRLGIP